MTPQQLEDRLIDFAVMVIDVVEALPNTKAGKKSGVTFRPSLQKAWEAATPEHHAFGIASRQ